MMSRYSDGTNFDYTPPSSPRGRRYILRNFNARKQRKATYPERTKYDEYTDIEHAQSTHGSQTSRSSNHIGTSNRVMPTENAKNTSPRKVSPRKEQQQRGAPVFVSPRKDIFAKPPLDKQKDINGNVTSQSPRKETTTNSPRKEGTTSPRKDKNNKNKVINDNMPSKKGQKGLTPRDEYMVTKLYESKIIYLKPSEVRYTHDQITAHFTDGRSMLSTFIALLHGKVEIRLGGNDVPPIEVMQAEEMDGKLWYVVNGNKRLYIFRRLERCGALDTMQVVARRYDTVEMDKHFLTRNKGRTIAVINDGHLDAKMKKEVQKWREGGGNKRPSPTQSNAAKKKPKPRNPPENDESCSCCIL